MAPRPKSLEPYSWRAKVAGRDDEAGLRHGFRSGLEEENCRLLESMGVPVLYEVTRIPFCQPAQQRHYTPDFELPNGILVETKGLFDADDRKKHLLVQQQHPGLDIRFVFQNPHAKLAKGSRTTYAHWCDKHQFRWATRRIPKEWIAEPGPKESPHDAIQAARNDDAHRPT